MSDIRVAQNEAAWPLPQAEYYQRSRDRAHRRFLSALKALALVRRLAVPVLQVNMTSGPQQNLVNGAAVPVG
jgi:hypothetical protein